MAKELKDKLVADINSSGLPITAVAYILQEILQQVTIITQQQIEEQKKQRDAASAAEKEQ